jgi:hypothetical protein
MLAGRPPVTSINHRLLTRRANLADNIIDSVAGVQDLAEGELLLKIDRFALSANNVTYAAFGDTIGYWQVFPTGREGWGHMPVWGFADVIRSRVPGVPEGARLWGYLPMADALRVQARNVTPRGLVDAAPHRAAVPQIYSRYTRCDGDPNYRRELEACQALFRPLFITSYTAAEHLRENDFFGARRLVISSASSKTAYGLAWRLRAAAPPLVALTSPANRAFVDRLGCYDEVIDYDGLEKLSPDVPTLYVDLAGSASLRSRVHHHFGAMLAHDCLVGSTQSDSFPSATDLPGPAPRFFFAAERLDRHRAQGTLPAFLDRFERDQADFYRRVSDPNSPWIDIVEREGLEAAAAIIGDLVDGRSDPAVGHLVRLPR